MVNYIFGNTSKIIKHLIVKYPCANVKTIGRNGSYDFYCDLRRPDEFDFNMFSPGDKVVFSAAISSPYECANNIEESNSINIIGTSHVIKKILETGAEVLFLSSDVVFENTNYPIFEDSPRAPENIYSYQKSIIEKIFEDYNGFYIYRLSYVYGKDDPFINYLLNCLKNDIIAEVFEEYQRSAVHIDDVVFAINLFLKKMTINKKVHICGDKLISKLYMAEKLSEKYDLRYKITGAPEDFFKYRVKKIEMKSKIFGTMMNRKLLSFGSFVDSLQL